MKKVFLDNQQIHIQEIEEPVIENDSDVLVEVSYSSICGYELMIYRGQASAGSNYEVGHEVSGVVLKTGKSVTDFKPGDPVVVSLNTHCGNCSMCRRGQYNSCLNMHVESNNMRERIVCPQTALYHLHDLSLREGCLIEPLTMAMCCVNNAKPSAGDRVLVLGGGAMGLLILKLLLLYPVQDVAVAEPNPRKREMALSFGATRTFDHYADKYMEEVSKFSDNEGYNIVIEASGSPASAKISPYFVSRGGRLVFFGLYGMNFELSLNLFSLYWNDMHISAVYPSTSYYVDAIKLAPRLKLQELITGEFPFEQAEEAFREKDTGNHVKVVLNFKGE